MLTRCHKRATDQAKHIFHRATTRHTQRPPVRRAWLLTAAPTRVIKKAPQPNFARNLTRSFFEIGHKRCNSNDANSTFEQATGELRATLLGNHPDQRGGRTHRQAAPVASRCTRYVALHPLRRATPVASRYTRYVALHPIRRGALPTDRVHCLRIGCTAHIHKPNRGEHPAARSLRPATVRTFTNSARNSLTATRNNTPETAGFQRSDFKS